MARLLDKETIHNQAAFDGNQVVVLQAIDSDTAPAVTDDITKGFVIGSRFLRVSTAKLYFCSDNTAGAAVWNILN